MILFSGVEGPNRVLYRLHVTWLCLGGLSVCYKFWEVQNQLHGQTSCRQCRQNKDSVYPPFIPEEDWPSLAFCNGAAEVGGWVLCPWYAFCMDSADRSMLPTHTFPMQLSGLNSVSVNADRALQPIGSVLTSEMPVWLLWISKTCHVPCVPFRADWHTLFHECSSGAIKDC